MVFSRTRKFSGQLRQLYERRPLLMNSLIGGLVYTIGELIVELQSARQRLAQEERLEEPSARRRQASPHLAVNAKDALSPSCDDADELHEIEVDNGRRGLGDTIGYYYRNYSGQVNWNRVASIGMLGVVQNGILMLTWYRFLSKAVGSATRTSIVLAKCVLDQIFFASQQDAVFLAYCGYLHSSTFETAWRIMTEQFVTTWINDCSLWPIVNFLGFAFVPTTLLPSFMSAVQLFWQIYISSMAAPKPTGDLSTPVTASLPFLRHHSFDFHTSIYEKSLPRLQPDHLETLKIAFPIVQRTSDAARGAVVDSSSIKGPASSLPGMPSALPNPVLTHHLGAYATSPTSQSWEPVPPVHRWVHSNDPDRVQAIQNAKYSCVVMAGLVALRTALQKV